MDYFKLNYLVFILSLRGCPACIESGGQDMQAVEEESQCHLRVCPHYSHLDISTTGGMVEFVRAFLYERDKKWSGVLARKVLANLFFFRHCAFKNHAKHK